MAVMPNEEHPATTPDAHQRLVGDYKRRSVNPDRLAFAENHAESPILDVGCGHGEYLKALADHEVVGVDVLAYEDRSRIVRGDAARLPFRDNTFHSVLMFEVLEHLPDPAAALAEIQRVATDNLLLSVPNAVDPPMFEATGLAMHPFVDETHVNFYDESTLREALEQRGFTVEEVRYINPVYPAILPLHAAGVPDRWARKIGRRFNRLPWTREYYMTLLVRATV